jgi:hypothetical protein
MGGVPVVGDADMEKLGGRYGAVLIQEMDTEMPEIL